MSKNQKTKNQFCTEVSMDTWKSTNALYMHMINRHERPLHRKCRIWDYKNTVRLLYCTYTIMRSLLGSMRAAGLT